LWIPSAFGFTANRVAYRFFTNKIRVYIYYTIPEIKQYRTAYADFKSLKKATAFYRKLLRGATFYLTNEEEVRFEQQRPQSDPW